MVTLWTPPERTLFIAMAKLNQPAKFSHTLPAIYYTSDAGTRSPIAMSSHPLHPISLEASLQSHGSDNLPPSPPHRGSSPSPLSPTDCCTLEKILRDVDHSSPPETPGPPEEGGQLFADIDRTGASTDDGADKNDKDYHLVGNETVDTGYEDEDDSMELSEGMEGDTMETSNSASDGLVTPAVSCSNIWPQDSVSTHANKDGLSQTGHGPSISEYQEAKRSEPNHHYLTEPLEGDTVEDCMNLPGKHAPPAHPQELDHNGLHHRSTPVEINQMDRMRFSIEKALENERAEQERVTLQPEPGVFIPSTDAPRHSKTQAVEQQSVPKTLYSDNGDNPATCGIAKTQHMVSSQHTIADSVPSTMSTILAPRSTENVTKSIPDNLNTAAKAPDWNQVQFAANQNMPETPFTKTLSYFKQYKGAENSPSRRRRNTALPQEIAHVVEEGSNSKDPLDLGESDKAQSNVRSVICPNETAAFRIYNSKPADGSLPQEADEMKEVYQAFMDVAREGANFVSKTADKNYDNKKAADASEPAPSDIQNQLIIYPQHPAFINAISMIPATIFWATAAPIVKYTNIAVDLLIDKLRDTYL